MEIEIKKGTVLIAKQKCEMYYSTEMKREYALIPGKEYKVKKIGLGIMLGDFIIQSEIDKEHYFDLTGYKQFFKIKK